MKYRESILEYAYVVPKRAPIVTTCTTMRTAVLASAVLLTLGILSLLLAEQLGLAAPLAVLALWMVLGAAGTLVAALVIAVWPGNAGRLSGCQH